MSRRRSDEDLSWTFPVPDTDPVPCIHCSVPVPVMRELIVEDGRVVAVETTVAVECPKCQVLRGAA